MRVLLIAATVALLTVACGSSKETPAPQTQVPRQLPTGTLDQILAPIALYPDALLAQILMSAGDPPKIAELDKWLRANTELKGTRLQDAAVKAGFEPSFVALALFPPVVARMAEQIAWTTLLGQAFAMDKTAVFAVIQKLRMQAKKVGTLKSTQQQAVETRKTSGGQEVIVIEPTNPQIIYVPQYNTEVVYTQPPVTTTAVAPAPVTTTSSSSTTVIIHEDNDPDVAVAAGLIGFTAGIAIGATMNNNYYYGPYGWHGGAYMYNEAWDDYYDHREDAREDWMDHREDLAEERSDRLEDRGEQRSDRRESTQEQRTDRQENRQENRPEAQGQRTERQQTRQESRPTAQTQPTERQQTRQESRPEAQTQPTERQQTRQESRPEAQTQPTDRQQTRQETGAASPTQRADRSTSSPVATQGATAATQRSERMGSPEARGYGDAGARSTTTQRSSGSRPDAFSGYSSGSSERAASSRGQSSRSSSSRTRSGGGGSRRR